MATTTTFIRNYVMSVWKLRVITQVMCITNRLDPSAGTDSRISHRKFTLKNLASQTRRHIHYSVSLKSTRNYSDIRMQMAKMRWLVYWSFWLHAIIWVTG